MTVILFVIFIPRSSEPQLDEVDVAAPTMFDEVRSIPVSHTFEDGAHRIKGRLTLPDPCYEIESEVIVMESYPEQVRINLTTPRPEQICAQVLTDKDFEVTFQASEQAVITAYLNDVRVELILDGKL